MSRKTDRFRKTGRIRHEEQSSGCDLTDTKSDKITNQTHSVPGMSLVYARDTRQHWKQSH